MIRKQIDNVLVRIFSLSTMHMLVLHHYTCCGRVHYLEAPLSSPLQLAQQSAFCVAQNRFFCDKMVWQFRAN